MTKLSYNIKILFVTGLLLTNISFATDYYATNLNELKSAISAAEPGDTLTMANGLWSDVKIVFQATGTEAAPILLRAETPGRVIINGRSNLRIAGDYLIIDGLRFVGGESPSGAVVEFRNGGYYSQYCRMTNCAIVDFNPSSRSIDYKWVSLYGSYNRVDHCYFEGKTHSGTTLVVWLSHQPNYHLIDSNYFAHRPELGVNGGETIRVGTSDWSMYDSYTIIENNYFEHCNGETEIISNKSCENIYRYNTFYECQGTLTLRHGNRCTVEGNFFIGNKVGNTGGVRVIGEDHVVFNNYFEGLYGSGFRAALPIMNGVPDSPLNRYFQVKNAVVAFNTFVDCRYPFILGAGADNERTLPPLNCVIANNAVKTDHTVIREDAEPTDLTWEGNIMQGSSLGIDQPEGIKLADPNFIRSDDGLWRPDENSPVLNAAAGEYPFVIEDMDGQSRNSNKDVGADQRSDEPIVRRPLTPLDAGPDWLQNSLPLVLSVKKVGSGQVTLDPAGQVYQQGTDVTLTAKPAEGWKFVQWDGDISGTENPFTVAMEQDVTVRVVFALDEPAEYSLNIFVFSSGGHVELDPPGGSYLEGAVVKLTAIPNEGWTFARWEGGLISTSNPDSVVMDSDKMVLGVFEQETSLRIANEKPLIFKLEQNYPNPFNPSTTISFSVKQAAFTQLDVYDNLGKHVKNVLSQYLSPGGFQVEVDARDLPSGVYFYRLRSGNNTAVRKMVVLE